MLRISTVAKFPYLKTGIVALFLLSFAGPYVCNFLCSEGIMVMGDTSHLQHENYTLGKYENEIVHHRHLAQQDLTSEHSHSLISEEYEDASQHPQNKQDDCCEQEKLFLLSSLFADQIEQFDLNAGHFKLSVVPMVSREIIQSYKSVWIGRSYTFDLPPPGSRNIRILIQSFLN